MTERMFAPSHEELVACLTRELELRSLVYPRFIDQKRMTAAKASKEIDLMQAAIQALEKLNDGRESLQAACEAFDGSPGEPWMLLVFEITRLNERIKELENEIVRDAVNYGADLMDAWREQNRD